jgi:methylase of polypeptide subunit release factors
VIGIDVQSKIIQYAKRNAINHNVFEKVHLINGDFFDLNLKGLKPDVVFLNPDFEKVF